MGQHKFKVYLEAAKRVADFRDSFACTAIVATTSIMAEERHKFNEVFSPLKSDYCLAYFGEASNLINRQTRTLALLLMQEIEDSGGL